jgi:hypothetical protein
MSSRKSGPDVSAPARPEPRSTTVGGAMTSPMISGALASIGTSEAPGMTEPMQISPDMLAALTAQAAVEMGPVLLPAGANAQLAAQAAQAASAITGTWRQNVLVTALWCVAETRNAWINLQNIGWRKIANGRDGSFMALVTLASQAKQTSKPITCREESDGMIYEIYFW